MVRFTPWYFAGAAVVCAVVGCAHFVEMQAIDHFTTALQTDDLNKLKASASQSFDDKALRRDKDSLAALKNHFSVGTLTGFGFEDSQPCLVAAGAVIIYLQETLKASLKHIRRLRPHRPDALLMLDEVTRRSLELTRTLRDNQRDGAPRNEQSDRGA